LGKSQGRELASPIAVILLHLLKLEASPAAAPPVGRQETIMQQRGDIERVLADSPSLRPTIPVIERELGSPGARRSLRSPVTACSHGWSWRNCNTRRRKYWGTGFRT
jgi:hypothetical protein